MKSVGQIGLKIPAAMREYYRFTGPSAELERCGLGSSRAELAWVQSEKRRDTERLNAGRDLSLDKAHSNQ